MLLILIERTEGTWTGRRPGIPSVLTAHLAIDQLTDQF